MFGQSWVRVGVVVPPEVPPDEPPGDVAAGDPDGSGLAALTIATPPAAIRPIASRTVATILRGPEMARSRGGGSRDVHPVGISFSSMWSPSIARLAEMPCHEPIGVASVERDLIGQGNGARASGGEAAPRSPRRHVPSSRDASL